MQATARLPRQGTRRTETTDAAERRGRVDIALCALLSDAGLRRSEAAALDAMRSGAPDAASVFGLRADTIARRVKAAARAAGLGSDFSGHSDRVGMARRMTRNGAPTAAVQRQGRWKSAAMVTRYTRAESAGEALRYL